MATLTTSIQANDAINVDRGTAYDSWLNPTYVLTSDDTRADPYGPNNQSDYLHVTKGAQPGVSPDTVVQGIVVKIEGQAGGTNPLTLTLLIGGTAVGDNKDLSFTTVDTTLTAGGPSELWGISLITADKINLNTFGVRVSSDVDTYNGPYPDHIYFEVTGQPGNMMMAM